MNSIRKTIAGTFLAGGLLLGAPVLATLVAAPASADNGFRFENDDFGIAGNDKGVIFANRDGDGFIATDDRIGVKVGGLQVNLED